MYRSLRIGMSAVLAVVLSLGVLAAGTAQAAKKVTAGTVKLSGKAVVGEPLAAAVASWKPAGSLTYTYQWYRSGKTIKAQSTSSYTLTASDLGKTITVKVTGSASGYTSASRTSAKSAKVAAGAQRPATPRILGLLSTGTAVRVFDEGWSAGTALSHQWRRDGKAIAKATGSSYTLGTADAGHTISVVTTGKLAGYRAASATGTAIAKAGAGSTDGVLQLGTELSAGAVYQAPGGTSCTWKRWTSPSAFVAGPYSTGQTITVATGRFLETKGCGAWTLLTASENTRPWHLGDGEYAIDDHLDANLFLALADVAKAGCRWAVVSDFSADRSATIAEGTATVAGVGETSVALVDYASARGFLTKGCTWNRVAT